MKDSEKMNEITDMLEFICKKYKNNLRNGELIIFRDYQYDDKKRISLDNRFEKTVLKKLKERGVKNIKFLHGFHLQSLKNKESNHKSLYEIFTALLDNYHSGNFDTTFLSQNIDFFNKF